MKLIIGGQYTECRGISIPMARMLSDQLRYLSPTANAYSYTYTSGKWDGFVRLYDPMRSRFPTGLLQRVKRLFDQNGQKYEIENHLPELHKPFEREFYPKFKPRPYQQEAVDAIVRWRRGVVSIPTGGGKTEVMQWAINALNVGRVVITVPNRALLRQTVRRMSEAFPASTIIPWGDGNKPPEVGAVDDYILVCTVQSAFKQAHPLLVHAKAVFIDESHHQAADTFQEAVRHCVNARVIIGFSATPYRHDNLDLELEAWVGPIIYQVDYEHLIQNGWLVPPKFYRVASLDEGLIASQGQRTFIFSEQEQDLRRREDVFNRYGVEIITGKTPKKKQEDALRRFREGTLTHIACTPVFDEGLDVPDMESVFFFSTCGSRTKTMQRIGRAMRNGTKLDGTTKQVCNVYDLLDMKYSERLEAYMKEPAFAARLGV